MWTAFWISQSCTFEKKHAYSYFYGVKVYCSIAWRRVWHFKKDLMRLSPSFEMSFPWIEAKIKITLRGLNMVVEVLRTSKSWILFWMILLCTYTIFVIFWILVFEEIVLVSFFEYNYFYHRGNNMNINDVRCFRDLAEKRKSFRDTNIDSVRCKVYILQNL